MPFILFMCLNSLEWHYFEPWFGANEDKKTYVNIFIAKVLVRSHSFNYVGLDIRLKKVALVIC